MRSAFSHCGLVCAASLCQAPDVTELHNPNVQKGAFQTAVIGGVKDLYGVVSIKSLFVQEWHHCLVWDYDFSVVEPSMAKSQSLFG